MLGVLVVARPTPAKLIAKAAAQIIFFIDSFFERVQDVETFR